MTDESAQEDACGTRAREPQLVETRVSTHWLDENGISRAKINAGADVALADVRAAMAASSEVMQGKKRPVLVDMRELSSATREARSYSAEDSAQHRLALPILIGSPISKVVGSFLLRVNRPSCPTQLFAVEAEAVAWLKSYL